MARERPSPLRPPALLLAPALILAVSTGVRAQDGKALYADACASCHGLDGRGSPTGTAIRVPLPDFTDCSFNTREPDSDWSFVVAHGGTAMGLSNQMPSYRGALTPDETAEVVRYLREFCRDETWPRGELNFRRPLFTAKAFPENEAVIVQRVSEDEDGGSAWTTQLQAERRVGARGQIELSVPFQIDDPSEGPTVGGIGDLAISYKHVLYASLPGRTIVSGSLEVGLPTGDSDRGLGDGTVKLEPSLHAGTGALAPFVLQGQLQFSAPVESDRADQALHYRLATSYPLGPLRRDWWPTLEFEVEQNLSNGDDSFFLTPQVYKAIRKRGHVAVAVGVQVPVGGHQPFEYRVVAFLLWEYLDGGLWW